jgi:hypothetical protein
MKNSKSYQKSHRGDSTNWNHLDASLAKKILKKIEKRSAKLIAEIKKNNHAN